MKSVGEGGGATSSVCTSLFIKYVYTKVCLLQIINSSGTIQDGGGDHRWITGWAAGIFL